MIRTAGSRPAILANRSECRPAQFTKWSATNSADRVVTVTASKDESMSTISDPNVICPPLLPISVARVSHTPR